jgi:hypothetical protein
MRYKAQIIFVQWAIFCRKVLEDHSFQFRINAMKYIIHVFAAEEQSKTLACEDEPHQILKAIQHFSKHCSFHSPWKQQLQCLPNLWKTFNIQCDSSLKAKAVQCSYINLYKNVHCKIQTFGVTAKNRILPLQFNLLCKVCKSQGQTLEQIKM